jgi:hypothetical protein
MLGTFADRTNCRMLAEGIERPEELDVFAALAAPLARGHLLRPAAAWAEIISLSVPPEAGTADDARGGNPRVHALGHIGVSDIS